MHPPFVQIAVGQGAGSSYGTIVGLDKDGEAWEWQSWSKPNPDDETKTVRYHRWVKLEGE